MTRLHILRPSHFCLQADIHQARNAEVIRVGPQKVRGECLCGIRFATQDGSYLTILLFFLFA